MSNTFSKFSKEEKENIWEMIKNNKSQKEISNIYSNYNRNIHFGVTRGRQWNDITNLKPFYGTSKRIGYTCRNGLFMVRKKIDGIVRVVFSSRNEKDILKYLNLDK